MKKTAARTISKIERLESQVGGSEDDEQQRALCGAYNPPTPDDLSVNAEIEVSRPVNGLRLHTRFAPRFGFCLQNESRLNSLRRSHHRESPTHSKRMNDDMGNLRYEVMCAALYCRHMQAAARTQ